MALDLRLARLLPGLLLALGTFGALAPFHAQAGEPAPEEKLPPPRREYMGRRIARTMHWTGAEWLLRETRESEERASLLFTSLGVKSGMTVADFGCGNGFHSLRLAKDVGPKGKVYGVDLQPEMLDMLRERGKAAGITNLVPVKSTAADPKLPPGSCDLILLVDVYHELAYPERVLAGLHRALKPTGRLALVEFRAEDPKVPIKKLHKMSRAQAKKELEANRFVLDRTFDGLPWQHLLFFRRHDAPVEDDGGKPTAPTQGGRGEGERDEGRSRGGGSGRLDRNG